MNFVPVANAESRSGFTHPISQSPRHTGSFAGGHAEPKRNYAASNGNALSVGNASTLGLVRSSRVTAITVQNLAGQKRRSLGSYSPASFAIRKFTEHLGKSRTAGRDFVLFDARLLQYAVLPPQAGVTCSKRGSGANGSRIVANHVVQLIDWSLTTSFHDSQVAEQSKRTRRRYAGHAIAESIGSKICPTTPFSGIAPQDVYKPPLIDLEARQRATGRKQAQAVQRERLSEGARHSRGVMRQSEPRHNFRRNRGGRLEEVSPPALLVIQVTECMYYSGSEVLNISSSDVMSAAEFDWKQAACAVTASGLEIDVQNVGKEQVIDLLAARIRNAQKTMKNNICNGMYSAGTGTGGKQLGGLQLLVPDDPTSGTVGGISRVNFSFWRSQVYDATTDGGAATSATNIQSYFNNIWLRCVRGTDKPDIILTGSAYYNFFWSSMQAIQRVTDPKMAQAGFQNLMFNTAPVVYEDNSGMPTQRAYFLNTDYIFLRYAAKRLFKPLERVQSINQDAIAQLITFAGNMTASNLSLQGVFKE